MSSLAQELANKKIELESALKINDQRRADLIAHNKQLRDELNRVLALQNMFATAGEANADLVEKVARGQSLSADEAFRLMSKKGKRVAVKPVESAAE